MGLLIGIGNAIGVQLGSDVNQEVPAAAFVDTETGEAFVDPETGEYIIDPDPQ